MNIEFKNLSVDFTATGADFSGDALLTVPSKYMENFMEHADQCPYGEDDFNNYRECCEDMDEDFECTNTDLQIIFMNWAMQQDEVISFQYEGDNLFWLYHDFHHAMNDVTGVEIYVNGHLEAERHYQAIALMKERNELYHIDIEFLKKHVEDFQERSQWDNNFSADDFDLRKACELASFDTEECHCGYCGHEGEPVELTDEEKEDLDDEDHTHKCEECEETGERYEFYYDILEAM